MRKNEKSMIKKILLFGVFALSGCAEMPEVETTKEPVLGREFSILRGVKLTSPTHTNVRSILHISEPKGNSKLAKYIATLYIADFLHSGDASHCKITANLIIDGQPLPLALAGYNQVKNISSLNVFSNNYMLNRRLSFEIPAKAFKLLKEDSVVKLDLEFKTIEEKFGNRILLTVEPEHVSHIKNFLLTP